MSIMRSVKIIAGASLLAFAFVAAYSVSSTFAYVVAGVGLVACAAIAYRSAKRVARIGGEQLAGELPPHVRRRLQRH